jgi:DNA-binding transcriptional ArsR family regulator
MFEKRKNGQVPAPDDVCFIDDIETLKVVADPLRLRILELLRRAPSTVKQLAKELDVPLKKLYYHVNLLETHSLIRVVGTRLVSGITEKQYQVTAHRLSVDRALLSLSTAPATNDESLDVLLSVVLDHTKSEIKKSVQAGLINPSETSLWKDGLALGRIELRLSPYQAEAFHARLVELSREFAALDPYPPDGDIRPYEVLLGVYPTLPPAAPEREGDD